MIPVAFSSHSGGKPPRRRPRLRAIAAGETTPQLSQDVLASARAVLGAIACTTPDDGLEAYQAVRPLLASSDFGALADELLFRAAEDLVEDGLPLDALSVAVRSKSYERSDVAWKLEDPLAYLMAAAPSAAVNVELAVAHAKAVARAAADYRAQVDAEQLAALAKRDPDGFSARLRELAAEYEAEARPHSAGLPLQRVSELEDPGPTEWLVEQLWTDSAFGIVGAEPKSWKSWLTLYLGICVAGGYQAFGRFNVRQGPVLVFSAEGGAGLVRRRAAALCRAMEVPIPEDLFIIAAPAMRLDDPDTAQRLVRTAEQHRPALIILDPLRELHDGDENDAVTIAALLGPLRQLGQLGVACMVVHHLGKKNEARGRGPQRGGQRLRGSSALHGATDSALYMETTGDGEHKRVTVVAEHRSEAEPDPIVLRLRYRKLPDLTVWLEIVDQEAEQVEKEERVVAEQDAKTKQILRAVAAASKPGRTPLTSASAIYQVVKGTKSTVLGLVKRLIQDGTLAQDDRGHIRVVEDDS